MTIRDKKLLYHLTAVENMASILQHGLLPRSSIRCFEDVADPEIINKRRSLRLERYVPFHWFCRNPFDGAVQMAHPGTSFALIAVRRDLAMRENWSVVPRHPLGTGSIQLMDYQEGFKSIQWEIMDRREYSDPLCKSVCMAECLAPGAVSASKFFKIYVPTGEVFDSLTALGAGPLLSVNPAMFVRPRM